MDCIICGGATRPFMKKHFSQFDLGDVEYERCDTCGFVLSKTHYYMTDRQWEELNHKWVSLYQGSDFNPEDPRWMERLENQCRIIGDWAELGLLPEGKWLDYGAGDGKLAEALQQRFRLRFLKYEHNSNAQPGYIPHEVLKPKQFNVVLHTAVIEHLRYREQIDALFQLVAEKGVMCLHTWVAEHIPRDPDWFFLLCVHCSFFTNQAMQVLFDRYGYTCSIYNVPSRLWLWSKQPVEIVRDAINHANARDKGDFYHYIFSERFVDYWK